LLRNGYDSLLPARWNGKIQPMNLQRTLNSRQAGIWALQISKFLTPALGLGFSCFVADRIAVNRQLPLVRAIRLNRWVISGEQLAGVDLDRAVRDNLRNIARSYYTLFHYLDHPAALDSLVDFDQAIQALIARSQEKKTGVLVAGLHLSNFDLVVQAAAGRGLSGLTLTLPDASENRQAVEWQHGFRRHSGMELIPASLPNFRLAIRRLQAGEIVLTGIDRPIRSAKYYPCFFGRPAHVPIHHIHLALAARVPVMLFAALQRPDGIYQILASEEIKLRPYTDRQIELVCNAERVLEVAASFIRQAPEQWSITLPAWPEALPLMS
jgi:lauroyl/myristoyl acyltransferase